MSLLLFFCPFISSSSFSSSSSSYSSSFSSSFLANQLVKYITLDASSSAYCVRQHSDEQVARCRLQFQAHAQTNVHISSIRPYFHSILHSLTPQQVYVDHYQLQIDYQLQKQYTKERKLLTETAGKQRILHRTTYDFLKQIKNIPNIYIQTKKTKTEKIRRILFGYSSLTLTKLHFYFHNCNLFLFSSFLILSERLRPKYPVLGNISVSGPKRKVVNNS